VSCVDVGEDGEGGEPGEGEHGPGVRKVPPGAERGEGERHEHKPQRPKQDGKRQGACQVHGPHQGNPPFSPEPDRDLRVDASCGSATGESVGERQ